MAGDVIDRAYFEIDGKQVYCDSIEEDPEDDTDFVTAMTPNNDPIGFRSGNLRYNLSAEVTMLAAEQVDFDKLWTAKRIVKAKVIFEGGKVHAYNKVVVAKPGTAAKHGEEVKRSIECKAYGRVVSS